MARIAFATCTGLTGFVAYIAAAVSLGDVVAGRNWMLQAAYFILAGTLWAIPAHFLILWAGRKRSG